MALTISELSPMFRVARGRPRPQSRGRVRNGHLGEVIPQRGTAADAWSLGPSVQAQLAQGLRYAQPYDAANAFLNRQFRLDSETDHAYTGEAAQARDWSAANAAFYPQVQVPLPPWAGPFPYQQPIWNAPAFPVWGSSWQLVNPPVIGGQGPAQLPVAGPGGFPTPGQSIEKF